MEHFTTDGYRTFSEMVSKEDFDKHLGSMKQNDILRFLDASLIYQQAMKCRACNSDITITLLCSAIEAVSAAEKSIIFKNWLMDKRLKDLANKDEKQVKEILNQAYESFMSSEENREGISYNFRRFLLRYCPEELRNPPLRILSGKGDVFEIAVRAIYSNFRSLYLHRGIGTAGFADKPIIDRASVHIDMTGIPLPRLLKADGNIVCVELTRVTDWFAVVVKGSLFRYLTSKKEA